ncbi:hydrolase, partial [Litorilinea aerophila]
MLIHNAVVLTFDDQDRVLESGAVLIQGDSIVDVGESQELRSRYPEEEQWDAEGLLLMHGQICAHTHFYGAFAPGMNIPGPPPADCPQTPER